MHRTVIALSLLLGAGALAIATSLPAYAMNPDKPNCHLETKCHLVTPRCYHPPTPHSPCPPAFKQCGKEKVCDE